MSGIDIAAAVLRGVHVAALASLFGTLLFVAIALPVDSDTTYTRKSMRRLALISVLVGLITGIAWLTAQSAAIAGADSVAMALHVMPTVALRTQFGHWMLVRLLLLIIVLFLLRRPGVAIQIALAGVALAVQPLLGHAGAIGGAAGVQLIASETLHLLAAGAWVGGLLPLLLAVGRLPHEMAAATCRSFTPIGLASVLLLAGTAVLQIAALMGGLPGLFGTGYGHVALLKLGLFVALVTLAALNRLVLTDRLAAAASTRLHMRVSIAAEILLGALVVIAAAFLASRTPGTHEQPIWPCSRRVDLGAFGDSALWTEPTIALGAAAIGFAIAVAGVIWRGIRWPALGLFAVIQIVAIPHLDVLFVAAYPPASSRRPPSLPPPQSRMVRACSPPTAPFATAPKHEAMVRPRGHCHCHPPISPRSISARTTMASSTGSSRTVSRRRTVKPLCHVFPACCRARRYGI
jgi:putative copper export protein